MCLNELVAEVEKLGFAEKIARINTIKRALHKISPFSEEPVDCVIWVKSEKVVANDYNPNSVAPPEMKLLEHSIEQDGYTQPIVSWEKESHNEVIDGFHRHRVGKESKTVNKRIHDYLPIVNIKKDRQGRSDRIASTIRHNRARGKHKVDSMSGIIVELKNRNWKNERIARELGMDEDEILRLCQITGLSGLFSDGEFSKSWDIENADQDFIPLDDDDHFEESEKCKVVNTSDEKRIFHTWEKWECYKAGFYNTTKEGMTKAECLSAYSNFFIDLNKFSNSLDHVINNWENSCQHYLTNFSMNRIAWLGQAAICHSMGIPSKFSMGFSMLSEAQQNKANETALIYLNKWLKINGHAEVTMEDAIPTRQSTIY